MSIAKRLFYFPHPITLYRSRLEQDIIAVLQDEVDIVNPSSDEVQDGFEAYMATKPDGGPMPYFVDLCKPCHGAMLLSFPDDVVAEGVPQLPNRIGSGVVTEVEAFWNREKPGTVWYIQVNPDGTWERKVITNWDGLYPMSYEETKAMLMAIDPDYRDWRKNYKMNWVINPYTG
jgi:hypothetical protein